MTMMKIPFQIREMGYDQAQVDSYLQKFADEYNRLQLAYNELNDQSNKPANRQPDMNMQAISKALVDAEVKALQIIEDAKSQASQITQTAYLELGQIQQQKERTMSELTELYNRLREMFPVNV